MTDEIKKNEHVEKADPSVPGGPKTSTAPAVDKPQGQIGLDDSPTTQTAEKAEAKSGKVL